MTELLSLSEIDDAVPGCEKCNGEGWVCENHDHAPWLEGDGCCGGAGMPCDCNPLSSFNK